MFWNQKEGGTEGGRRAKKNSCRIRTEATTLAAETGTTTSTAATSGRGRWPRPAPMPPLIRYGGGRGRGEWVEQVHEEDTFASMHVLYLYVCCSRCLIFLCLAFTNCILCCLRCQYLRRREGGEGLVGFFLCGGPPLLTSPRGVTTGQQQQTSFTATTLIGQLPLSISRQEAVEQIEY